MNNNSVAVFNFKGQDLIIQCLKYDKMKDICQKCADKLKMDINSLYFIYGGTMVNFQLSFIQQANIFDKERNTMNILVNINENDRLKCPKCGTNIKLESKQINEIISSVNEIKNNLDGMKSIIESIVKNILLFNTDIDDGINVYLNNEKKNIIKDQNKRLIDFYPTEIGKYSFEIIFNNKLTSLKCFFSECSNITSLDLTNFDSSNVTDMYRMFNRCTKLKEIKGLNNLNTNKVTNMSALFQYCQEIENLNLSNFNTSQVIKMGGMFGGCKKLKEIKGINNFSTNKVIDMNSMFGECLQLEYLDLSNFNTSNVTNMMKMFNKCKKLKKVILNNFDTSNVTNMAYMFSECFELKIIEGIKKFNTKNVTEMKSMFNECSVLEDLDLSSFNTSKVTSMKSMFYKCDKLKNLNLLNFEINNNVDIEGMFIFKREANFRIISNNINLINIYQNFTINISLNKKWGI